MCKPPRKLARCWVGIITRAEEKQPPCLIIVMNLRKKKGLKQETVGHSGSTPFKGTAILAQKAYNHHGFMRLSLKPVRIMENII